MVYGSHNCMCTMQSSNYCESRNYLCCIGFVVDGSYEKSYENAYTLLLAW